LRIEDPDERSDDRTIIARLAQGHDHITHRQVLEIHSITSFIVDGRIGNSDAALLAGRIPERHRPISQRKNHPRHPVTTPKEIAIHPTEHPLIHHRHIAWSAFHKITLIILAETILKTSLVQTGRETDSETRDSYEHNSDHDRSKDKYPLPSQAT
jgi:hypothetical protein